MTNATQTIADPASDIQITDQEVQFYKKEGYLVIPGLLQRDMAEAILKEVNKVLTLHDLSEDRMRRASGSSDKLRQFGDLPENSLIKAMVFSQRILNVAQRIMEGPSTPYLPFTAVKAGGGGGQFHFHQDNQYTRHDGPSCNIWIALVPMNPNNGCLCVEPRSHLNGTLESQLSGDGDNHKRTQYDPSYYLPVRMNPGDAIAFTRLTVHGSGPNSTSEARSAYALQYHRDDTNFLDPVDKTWKNLKQNPRWQFQYTPAL